MIRLPTLPPRTVSLPWAAALLATLALPAWAAGSAAAGQTFLWLATMLMLARLSSLVEKIGMPGVLGELLMGVALGNLTLVGIDALEVVSHDPVLAIFAELGVVILLFQIGLETTVDELRRVGWRALGVASVGVVLPFLLGTYAIGPLMFADAGFHTHLFIGATLCATSVGITGRVFRDAGQLGSPEARIVLGAAVLDDVMGLIVLAVVSGFVQSGSVSGGDVALIVLQATGFLLGAVLLGRAIAPSLGYWLARVHAGTAMKLTLLLSVGLLLAWAAYRIGLAPIIGAFAAGVLLEPVFLERFDKPEIVRDLEPYAERLPEPQQQAMRARLARYHYHHHEQLLEPLGHFLVPIFFVYTGMQVELSALFDPWVALSALVVTVVAIAGKVAAGLVAGAGHNRWLVGWGMVPRGEVGLIFAAVGHQLGVVDDRLFSIIVAMVILTTLVTPPVLAVLLKKRAAATS